MISQPTLLIYGDMDDIIKKSRHNDLKDLIPSVDVKVVNNGHHRIMAENYKEVNKLINNFLIK